MHIKFYYPKTKAFHSSATQLHCPLKFKMFVWSQPMWICCLALHLWWAHVKEGYSTGFPDGWGCAVLRLGGCICILPIGDSIVLPYNFTGRLGKSNTNRKIASTERPIILLKKTLTRLLQSGFGPWATNGIGLPYGIWGDISWCSPSEKLIEPSPAIFMTICCVPVFVQVNKTRI